MQNNERVLMYQNLARFPPEDRIIIEAYGPYIMLVPFWVGFESYELGSFKSPYSQATDVRAFGRGLEAALRVYKRRGHCPTCS
jgi:hypothetical protein